MYSVLGVLLPVQELHGGLEHEAAVFVVKPFELHLILRAFYGAQIDYHRRHHLQGALREPVSRSISQSVNKDTIK